MRFQPFFLVLIFNLVFGCKDRKKDVDIAVFLLQPIKIKLKVKPKDFGKIKHKLKKVSSKLSADEDNKQQSANENDYYDFKIENYNLGFLQQGGDEDADITITPKKTGTFEIVFYVGIIT